MSYNTIGKFDFSMFDQVGTLAMFHLNVSHNNLKELMVTMPSSFERDIGEYEYDVWKDALCDRLHLSFLIHEIK